MPQLMPLMWVLSFMMSMLIVLTLINMYYYKGSWILYYNVKNEKDININMLW